MKRATEKRLALVGGMFWLAFLCAALGVPAASAGEQLFTEHHVAKLRDLQEAAISPDGKHVAYVVRVPRKPGKEEDGPGWRELHVTDTAGASHPYVTGQVTVTEIAWTPDGTQVSFLVKRGGDQHVSLYAIPLGGGEARRLLSHGAEIKEYAWSPDGKRIAFLAEEATSDEKKKLRAKGFSQQIFEEEWRPVRVWIAEPGVEGSEPRALELPGSASELRWSPVDSRLAVALAPTSLVDDRYMKRKLHVVDADSGEVLRRFDNPGKLGQVAWSPDGAHLALVSAADLHDPKEGRLMVGTLADGTLRDVLPGYAGHVTAVAWQDSETVMYLGEEGVWTTFNKIRLDGSEQKTIVAAGGAILTDFTLSSDGQSGAFIGQTPTHPPEVYLMRHGDSEPRRVSDNNPWLAEMRLAPQEVITFHAADGLELEGILIRPLEEEDGKRYPLILDVHGGPESHFRNGWLTNYHRAGQVGAARGFAVFYPNYRGSTGRGVEFSKLSQGEPAGKEFDDLVDAVDHLIETGLVDMDRVGITGGSYGGFASAWAATYYSEHFAAAVMFVGISDHIAKAGTTDIPNEIFLVHQLMRPWEDWEFFLERSPLFHAERARTPILILRGAEDPRVHPSQSLLLYRYLKILGQVPVRLVSYPGEKHGNERAASRLDYNLRLLRWMEHYLKGPGGAPPPHELDYGLGGEEAGSEH